MGWALEVCRLVQSFWAYFLFLFLFNLAIYTILVYHQIFTIQKNKTSSTWQTMTSIIIQFNKMSTRHEAEEQGTVEADKHHFMRCEHANCNFETINTSFMADHHLQTHTNYIMRFGILEHLYKFTPVVQQHDNHRHCGTFHANRYCPPCRCGTFYAHRCHRLWSCRNCGTFDPHHCCCQSCCAGLPLYYDGGEFQMAMQWRMSDWHRKTESLHEWASLHHSLWSPPSCTISFCQCFLLYIYLHMAVFICFGHSQVRLNCLFILVCKVNIWWLIQRFINCFILCVSVQWRPPTKAQLIKGLK